MNMAAVWSLPVVFVCENNGFGEFTALEDVTAGKSLPARGRIYDIPSSEADGMDVLAVRSAFGTALARARRGEGPSFLVLNTYRFGGHHAGDKQDYKDKEEMQLWQERDPILQLGRHLLANGLAKQEALDAIAAEIEQEIRAAVAFAKAAPEPAPEDLLSDVFA
jgi:pyruvate dehydrogenase E1 component alpha subunit